MNNSNQSTGKNPMFLALDTFTATGMCHKSTRPANGSKPRGCDNANCTLGHVVLLHNGALDVTASKPYFDATRDFFATSTFGWLLDPHSVLPLIHYNSLSDAFKHRNSALPALDPLWPAYQPDPSYDQSRRIRPGRHRPLSRLHPTPAPSPAPRGCSNPALSSALAAAHIRLRWLPCNTATTPRRHIPRCRLAHRCSIPVPGRRHRLTTRCRSKALCLTHLNPECRTTTTRNHSGHRHPGPLHTPHRCKSRHQCRHLRRLRSWPLPRRP